MDRIIVGVDGSDTATRAAEKAARTAAALGAELIVVSAFNKLGDTQVAGATDTINYTANDIARKVAEQTIEGLRSAFPDLRAVAHAEYGAPADALLKTAEDFDASLIVVGNKRVQGVARILGSIATTVARHAPCDVYIAHTQQ